ncbi:right-handed parallel beta-helix repeat-containing protein [Hoeflea prorocentri]|uniref:Right-handed parallel beta-helix repeat-containing protein n=1 Tax=Hoeflea prorocentri TaxID=1922333 RepID=A0A9X3UNJ0_9HYPH|nr:right-handed parallel beta-helix repeat-containing protein [Hoeflea prorocentri]MCY6383660.1 right-handed parallel beta-helix repeat-containing protein [Hoeflea prorocentri]MDA5401460.1 right-handed parallel beta-helix repeat-containing protein [Hoeflea prorocentri]
MTISLPSPKRGSIVLALLCSTALIAPSPLIAQEVIDVTDPLLITNALTPGGLGVEAGDTVVIDENVSIIVDNIPGLDFFQLNLDDVSIINNGSIWTNGTIAEFYGDGIYLSRGNNISVTNNGSISVGDGESSAIYLRNVANSQVVNNGLLEIRAEAAEEIEQNQRPGLSSGFSAGMRVDAYESITDSNDNITGAIVRTGNLLVNNNTIMSNVLQSRGMYIDGATGPFYLFSNSTAVNNGNILMMAEADIRSFGTFDNSGLRAEGHGNTLINNGLIEIHPEGFGIDGNGAANTIRNYGTIRTFYGESHGIENYRNQTDVPAGTPMNETYNFGHIESFGAPIEIVEERVVFDQDGNPVRDQDGNLVTTIENSQRQGRAGHGVSLTGHQFHKFVNAGTIISHHGYSIDVSADQPTDDADIDLHLNDGSILYGDVFVSFFDRINRFTGVTTREGNDKHTSLALGDGLNATIRFDLFAESGRDNNGNATLRGGALPDEITSYHNSHVVDEGLGIVYVADLDSYSQQDQALWRMTSILQDAIEAGSGTQLPANTYGFAKNVEGRWTRAFGGGLFAQRDGAAPAYNAGSAGLVTGVESQPLGFHGGVAVSHVAGNEDVSYETTSASVFGGVSSDLAESVGYSFTVGAAVNSTDRDQADNRVMGGIDSDSANYASIFVTPSVRVDGPIRGSSVRLLYTGLWQQGHTFNFPAGTILSVDDRFANFVQSRFQMQHRLGAATLAYGVEASWTDGQDMSFSLMGTDLATPYDDGFYSRFFSRVHNDKGYLEVGYDTEKRATAEAGLKITF